MNSLHKFHSFHVDHAVKYGLSKAVILQHITYWLDTHKCEDKHYHVYENDQSEHNGKTFYWSFFTAKGIQKQFPYLGSEQAISRLIRQLEDDRVLISCQLMKQNHNRTKSYSMPHYERMFKNELSVVSDSLKVNVPSFNNERSYRSNNRSNKIISNPKQKNGFAKFEEIPLSFVSDEIEFLKAKTFGKRFDQDWYNLVFEMFCASNDEKREMVPDNEQIKKRFKLYALATGKNDQGSDYRYNNSVSNKNDHVEKQIKLWEMCFDQIPERALYILSTNDLLDKDLAIWNSYINSKLKFKDNFIEGERLKHDFEDFINKNKYRFNKLESNNENDLQWLDELNDEIKTGGI